MGVLGSLKSDTDNFHPHSSVSGLCLGVGGVCIFMSYYIQNTSYLPGKLRVVNGKGFVIHIFFYLQEI